MNKRTTRYGMILAAWLCATASGLSAAPDAETLARKVENTWGTLEISLTAVMKTARPGRDPVETDIRILRIGSAGTRIDFLAPEKDRGKIILQLGGETWLYLPRADRKVNVPAHRNPLAGGVLFEDLFPGRTELDEVSVTESEEAFVLTGTTTGGKRRKTRGTDRTYFHRTSLLPFRREYYSRSGKLLKTVHIDEYREWNGVPIPWKVRFVDHLKNGAEASITIRSATTLKEGDRRLFSKETLGAGDD